MKAHVRVVVPWEDGAELYFEDASGIPPHTLVLNGIKELKEVVKGILPAFDKAMNDHQMCGNLSEERMSQLVHQRDTAVLNKLEELKRDVAELKSGGGKGGSAEGRTPGGKQNSPYRWFTHHGKMQRVPDGWQFPFCDMQTAYGWWHHGDETAGVSPMKMMVRSDMAHAKGRDETWRKG